MIPQAGWQEDISRATDREKIRKEQEYKNTDTGEIRKGGKRRVWGGEDRPLKMVAVWDAEFSQSPNDHLKAGSSGTLQGVQRILNPLRHKQGLNPFPPFWKTAASQELMCKELKCKWELSSCFAALQRLRWFQRIWESGSEMGLFAVVCLLCVPRLPGDKHDTSGVCFAEPPNAPSCNSCSVWALS